MVALDPVFYRANLSPQGNAGFRANSAIFLFFFPFFFFVMDTIQGRNWKVGLDEITGLTCQYLSYGKVCPCFHSPRGGEERVFSPPAPSSVYSRALAHEARLRSTIGK